jgi:hypothetical protein
MNMTSLKTVSVLLLSAAVLGGCGGGGDDNAGSLTPFSTVPAEITVTVPTGGCQGGAGIGSSTRVFVYGGAAPYRLDNTAPDAIALDKTVVENRGDFFTATLIGGCVDPALVVVVDANDRQVTVKVVYKEEDN